MILNTTALIEVTADTVLTPKIAYQLRQRLDEVLEEAVNGVLAEFDIHNQFARAVCVDEVEVEQD